MLKLLALVLPLLPEIWEAIRALVAAIQALPCDGGAKRRAVVSAVRDALDLVDGGIPGWESLTEAQRDRVLDGLVELAYLALALDAAKRPRAQVRQGLQTALRLTSRQAVARIRALSGSSEDSESDA